MATEEIALTEGAWTDLGPGPFVAETKHSNDAFLHIGAVVPGIASTAHHSLNGPSSFSYGGTENGWARAQNGTAKLIRTPVV